ncbi:hypothetical protein [Enterococcus casseliflavus]|uniref:hypothetical protein n=1 Tax=Enterococcus casseliflavus TaxID=37734 RepID=UPI003019FD5F
MDDVVYVKFLRNSSDQPAVRAFGDFAVHDFHVLALRRNDDGRWLANGIISGGWPTNAQPDARASG